MTKRNDEIEVMFPTRGESMHFRFQGDYKTFCGTNCEHWSVTDITLAKALDNPCTCRVCVKVAFCD